MPLRAGRHIRQVNTARPLPAHLPSNRTRSVHDLDGHRVMATQACDGASAR